MSNFNLECNFRGSEKFSPLRYFLSLVFCLALLPSSALAQAKDKKKDGVPGGFPPNQETMQKIRDKTAELGKALAALREKGARDPILADVEVFQRAAQIMVRNNDFNYLASGTWTLEVLDLGLARAKLAANGKAPWAQPGQHAIRAYRSRVDGSLQPYAVSLPSGLDKSEPGKTWRIDVVLHGRNDLLTEVAFLRTHKDKAAGNEAAIHIDVFGRGNNAYRWAGETDVFEALDSFFHNERLAKRDYPEPRKSSCAASPWAGPASGTSACIIPIAGASSDRGPGFPTPRGWPPITPKSGTNA